VSVVCCQVEVSGTRWSLGVLPTVMRHFVWSTNLAIASHFWLRLNTRCITGCVSYMPLIVTVSTIAECLLTDCNILGDNKKYAWIIKRLTLAVIWLCNQTEVIVNRNTRWWP